MSLRHCFLIKEATCKSAVATGGWKSPERSRKPQRFRVSNLRGSPLWKRAGPWYCSSRNSTSTAPAVQKRCLTPCFHLKIAPGSSHGCHGAVPSAPRGEARSHSKCWAFFNTPPRALAAVNNINLSAFVLINPLRVRFPAQESRPVLSTV